MSKFCLAMVVAAACCGSVALAADDNKKDKKMAADHPADGTEITVTGMMAIKAEGAKSDVVCRIVNGKGKTAQLYNLVATGELATSVEAKHQSGDKVKVTGKVKGDDLIVSKIETLSYMKK